ncbi:MAG TPA: VanZ family protein [Oscillospiraceae bacterium]|nr:VanZ family protein [Oscillospiraceae bacterium]
MSKIKRTKTILSWALVVLWMCVIFASSSQPALVSAELSTGLTAVLVRTVAKVLQLETPEVEPYLSMFNHLLRKAGHFTVYLILATLVVNALRQSGVTGRRLYLMAFTCCLLYAITDEVHQLFVPGRGGQVRDVLLDSCGALVAILCAYVMSRRKTKDTETA